MSKEKRKNRWLVIVILICTLALIAYVWMELDADQVTDAFASMKPFWLVMLFACMGMYYCFDALKYKLVTESFGCAQSYRDSLTTSMLGFFYSAITPMATGGQPFQIYHMNKRGIPAGTATSVICMVYMYWKVALVSLGVLGFIIYSNVLLDSGAGWIPFLMLGLLLQMLALGAVLLSALKPRWVSAIGSMILKGFFSLDLFSSRGADPSHIIEKWNNYIDEYHTAYVLGSKNKRLMLVALLCAFAECVAYMSVAYCSYRGFGMSGQPYYRVMFLQVLLYLGASLVPTPGAAGASEGGFMAVYRGLFGAHLTMSMLVWRLATYYLTLLVGYLFVVADRMDPSRKRRNRKRAAEEAPSSPAVSVPAGGMEMEIDGTPEGSTGETP